MRTLAPGSAGGGGGPPAVAGVVTGMQRTGGSLCPFQSVSALVDKFKKNDQVFDINAEVEESDCGDFPIGALEDDFDANDELDYTAVGDHTAAGDHTKFGSWKEPCHVQSCQ